MEKPRVLFIGNKYYHQTVESGFNNTQHYIIGTAEESGVELDVFHFDKYFLENDRRGDDAVIDMAKDGNYDFILLDFYLASDLNPRLETLRHLNVLLNIPIVCIWWDHIWNIHCAMASMIQEWINLNVVVDSGEFFTYVYNPQDHLFLWTPQDPKLYYPREKEVDIAFYGRKFKVGRQEAIEELKNIDGFVKLGGKDEEFLSPEDYAERFGRTKIIVNFSKSNSGGTQMVGHTMEAALSGCLLLEQQGKETPGFFVKGQDYIEWTDIEDLIEKAKYYMEHEKERAEIANRALVKANKYYNCKTWWETVCRHTTRGKR